MKRFLIVLTVCMLVVGMASMAFASGQSSGGTQGGALASGQNSPGEGNQDSSEPGNRTGGDSQDSDQTPGSTQSGTSPSGQGSYVTGNQNGSGAESKLDKGFQAGEGYRAGLQELEGHRNCIRVQNQEILQLRTQIKECSEELKLKTRNMLKNRENISLEQIFRTREAIRSFREVREQIRSEHHGEIGKQVENMRQARNQKNLDGAKAALSRIQDEQQRRIKKMSEILSDMEELLETL